MEDIDPKQFVSNMYRPRGTWRNATDYFRGKGFKDVTIMRFVEIEADTRYWSIQLYIPRSRKSKLSPLRQNMAPELLAEVLKIEAKRRFEQAGTEYGLTFTNVDIEVVSAWFFCSARVPIYEIAYDDDEMEAGAVVETLLEADAELKVPKAEIRILPANIKHHHDVVLISDHSPVYVGTIAPKHSVWRVIKTASGVGREMLTKLHWHAITKEECAMRMVEVMRPFWKPIIASHAMVAEADEEDIDPKKYAPKWDFDLASHVTSDFSKWWKPGTWYRYRNGDRTVILTYKGGNRPNREWGVSVSRPGRGHSFELTTIVADELQDAVDKGSWIAEKFYSRLSESEEEDIDPKKYADFGNLRTLRDLQQYPDDQVFLCSDPVVMDAWGQHEPFYCWRVIWKSQGIVSVEFEKRWASDTPSGYGSATVQDYVQIKYLKPVSRVGAKAAFESEEDDLDAKAFVNNGFVIMYTPPYDDYLHSFIYDRDAGEFDVTMDVNKAKQFTTREEAEALLAQLHKNQETVGYSIRSIGSLGEAEEEDLDPKAFVSKNWSTWKFDVQGTDHPGSYVAQVGDWWRFVNERGQRAWITVAERHRHTDTHIIPMAWSLEASKPSPRAGRVVLGSSFSGNFDEARAEMEKRADRYYARILPHVALMGEEATGEVAVPKLSEAEEDDFDAKQFINSEPEIRVETALEAAGYRNIQVNSLNGGLTHTVLFDLPGSMRKWHFTRRISAPAKDAAIRAVQASYPGACEFEFYAPGSDSDFTLCFRTQVSESVKDDIDVEAAKAEKPASGEQAEAGNYKKGHVSLQGFQIAIENAKGSTREGVDKDGKPWKIELPAHYGYLKGTVGRDKDHLDCYIGDNPGGMLVFVVNQNHLDGGFDEHKIMLGFSSKDEAVETYDKAYSGGLGPKLRDSVVSTTIDGLKAWISSGKTKKPFERLDEALIGCHSSTNKFRKFDTSAEGAHFANQVKPVRESGEPDDVDPKAMALRTSPPPRRWGQLEVGTVVYSGGAYERVESKHEGYGPSYQDASGRLVVDNGVTTIVSVTGFNPCYAYGRYAQRSRINGKADLLDSEVISVEDNSDAALWALVDVVVARHRNSRRVPESVEPDDVDPKSMALDTQRYGDLQPGMVVKGEDFDNEYFRIYSVNRRIVRYHAFSPRSHYGLFARSASAPIRGQVLPYMDDDALRAAVNSNLSEDLEDDIDPKDYTKEDHPIVVEPVPGSPMSWGVHRAAGYAHGDVRTLIGTLFYDETEIPPGADPTWAELNWFASPLSPCASIRAFRTREEAIDYIIKASQ